MKCPYCHSRLDKPGNLIWTKHGPAHFSCWRDEITREPVRKQPLQFDPNLIYGEYYDAMTKEWLHPRRVINRMNKRQFDTFILDTSYDGPFLEKTKKKR